MKLTKEQIKQMCEIISMDDCGIVFDYKIDKHKCCFCESISDFYCIMRHEDFCIKNVAEKYLESLK